jgi:hypothetical protein
MAISIFGDARDESEIVVIDKNTKEVMTSIKEQDAQFAAGRRFMATMARVALVEALLLYYLVLAKQCRKISFDEKSQKRIAASRITFGQINAALQAAGAYHEPDLFGVITSFVDRRNKLVHHLVAGSDSVDLDALFADGQKIAFRLWLYILKITRPHISFPEKKATLADRSHLTP